MFWMRNKKLIFNNGLLSKGLVHVLSNNQALNIVSTTYTHLSDLFETLYMYTGL